MRFIRFNMTLNVLYGEGLQTRPYELKHVLAGTTGLLLTDELKPMYFRAFSASCKGWIVLTTSGLIILWNYADHDNPWDNDWVHFLEDQPRTM